MYQKYFSHDPKRVAALLGGEARGNHVSAPGPGHSPKDRSLSVQVDPSAPFGFLVHSFADDQRLAFDHVRRRLGIDQRRSLSRPPPSQAKPAWPQVKTDDEVRQTSIWNEAVDPRGTLAQTYLAPRGIALTDDLCGRVLRLAASCPFGPGRRVPALLAAFHPLRGRECREYEANPDDPPTAIIRIGLSPDSAKIGKNIGKMMLGPVGGCAIKLDADEDVSQGLGIAEGLETALRVRGRGWRPVWALGSAGAIEKFPPLSGVEALTIFADNDASGRGIEAARACAARWRDAGSEVFIRPPNKTGADWADIA